MNNDTKKAKFDDLSPADQQRVMTIVEARSPYTIKSNAQLQHEIVAELFPASGQSISK